MKDFLMNQAIKTLKDLSVYSVEYNEDINQKWDKWLDTNTSYVWKVATLALIDSNKCDFVHVFIAHQREQSSEPEFIGELYWSDGENDDIGRCLDRYLKCLRKGHPVFDNN